MMINYLKELTLNGSNLTFLTSSSSFFQNSRDKSKKISFCLVNNYSQNNNNLKTVLSNLLSVIAAITLLNVNLWQVSDN